MGGRAKWDWVCLTQRRAKKCRQGVCDIGLAGASAVASATVQRRAQRCLGRGGCAPLLRGLAVVLEVSTRTLVAGPSSSSSMIELVRWMRARCAKVARLTSLGLRSSRVSFAGAGAGAGACWLALRLLTSTGSTCCTQTKPKPHHRTFPTRPRHCPSAVRASLCPSALP